MPPYPFSAVVGLDDLRLALLLNAVSPAIGGVLVRGEKGTAKSTVVRALATLLPTLDVVEGCRFSCDPGTPDPACPDGPHEVGVAATTRAARLVELPVGASEDRVVGSLDLERALTEGVKAYEPGLLADAHRGVLYVDEVNLLHDHLVDLLLDAAALGTSYVEREGVSVRHASRFLLVGTMNPEEGELRPQLLDRFGLTVEVRATREVAERVDVVRRRLAYEADADTFAASYAGTDAALATRIAEARGRVGAVVLGDDALFEITGVCAAFEVDGLRADIVMARTAVALAAWHGRSEVTGDDVRQAALLALPHRRRRLPFEEPGLDEQQLDDALEQARENRPQPPAGPAAPDRLDPPEGPEPPDGDGGGGDGDGGGAAGSRSEPSGDTGASAPHGLPADFPDAGAPGAGSDDREQSASATPDGPRRASPERTAGVGATFRPVALQVPGVNRYAGAAGRRSRAEGSGAGRLTRATLPRTTRGGVRGGIHLTATLTAAAPYQMDRGRRSGQPLALRRGDLREGVREGREGNLVLFCVDASGSMAARDRMSAVKGAVLSLLLDAYQRRDKVGLVTFRGDGAEVLLPPTSSVDAAARRLAMLPTGGRTPLSLGLHRSAELLAVERVRDPRRRPLLVVVTDGRATSGGPRPVEAGHAAGRRVARAGVAAIVVDAESGVVRLGLAGELARHLGAPCLRLEELAAAPLAGMVRELTGRTSDRPSGRAA